MARNLPPQPEASPPAGPEPKSRPSRSESWVSPEQVFDAQIRRARGQIRAVEMAVAVVTLLAGALGYLLAMAVVDHWLVPGGLGTVGRTMAWLGLMAGCGWFLVRRFLPLAWQPINPVYAAATIEQAQPSLKNSLINFLLLRNDRQHLAPAIYQAVEMQAASDASRVPVEQAVDRSVLIRMGYVLIAVVALACFYKLFSPKDPLRSLARVVLPWADISRPTRVQIFELQPGSAAVFHGETVTVSAVVRGARRDEPVRLFYSTADGQIVDRAIPLELPEDSYRHRGMLPPGGAGIQQDLRYYLAAGDARTAEFTLTAVTAPALLIDKVEYQYPEYTGLLPREVERQGDLQAIEGTQVTIWARANLPLRSAHLDYDCNLTNDLPLNVRGSTARGQVTLRRNEAGDPEHASYQLRFVSQEGKSSLHPIRYRIEVLADEPPQIAFTEPTGDPAQVAANGALTLAVRAIDPDFRLEEVTLWIERADQPKQREPLLVSPHVGEFRGAWILDGRRMRLREGEQIQVTAEAIDGRPAGANRAMAGPLTLEVVGDVTEAQRQEQLAQAQEEQRKQEGAEPPLTGDRLAKRTDQRQPERSPRSEAGGRTAPQTEPSPSGEPRSPEDSPGDSRSDSPEASRRQDRRAPTPPGQPPPPADPEPGDGDSGQDETGDSSDPNEGDSSEGEGSEGEGSEGGNPKGEGREGSESSSEGADSGDNPATSSDSAGGDQGQQERVDPDSQPGDAFERILEHQRQEQGTDPLDEPGAESDQPPGGEDQPSGDDPAGGGSEDQQSGGGEQGHPQPGDASAGGQPDSAGASTPGAGDTPSPDDQPPGGGQGSPGGEGEGSSDSAADGAGPSAESGSEGSGSEGSEGQEGSEPAAGERSSSGERGGQGGADGSGAEAGSAGQDDSEASAGRGQEGSEAGGQGAGDGQEPGGQEDRGGERPQGRPSGERSGPGAGEEASGTDSGGAEGQPRDPAGSEGGAEPQDAVGGAEGSESGAGAGQEGHEGSPAAETPQRGRGSKSSGSEPSGERAGEASSPSQQGSHSSESEGSEGGDRSGGGDQGGGQQSNSPGSGSGGQNTPSESGGGAAPGAGEGPTGDSAGEGTEPASDAGGDSSRRGPGRAGQGGEPQAGGGEGDSAEGAPPPSGDAGAPPSDGSGNSSGGDSPQAGAAGSGNPSAGAAPGRERAAPDGAMLYPRGGAPGQHDGPRPQSAPVAGPDQANLDYARRATDLALEYLNDQMERGEVDEALLRKLKWTPEDMARFLKRWQQLKEAAQQGGAEGELARQRLDQALSGLGLRRRGVELTSEESPEETARDVRASRRADPPAEYREQFRAFTEGTATDE